MDPWIERWLGQTVALDTNVLIYYFVKHPTYYPVVHPIFQALESDDLQAIVSVVTEAELRTLPESQKDAEGLHALGLFFQQFPNVTVVPVTRPIARIAAQLRGTHRLRLPDALIIGTAIERQCAAVIGNDAGWRDRTDPCPYVHLDALRPTTP